MSGEKSYVETVKGNSTSKTEKTYRKKNKVF